MLYSADYTTELWTTEDQQFDQLFPEPPKKVKAEKSIRQLGDFQHFLNTKASIQYEYESANIRIPYHNPLYQDVKVKTIEDRRLERERAKQMSKNSSSKLDISRLLEQVQNSVASFNPGKPNVKQNGAGQKMCNRPMKMENVPINNQIKSSKNVSPVQTKSFKIENVHEKMISVPQGTVREKSKPGESEKSLIIGKENVTTNDTRVHEKVKDCQNFKVQGKQDIVHEKVKPVDRVSPPQFQKRPRKTTPNSSQAPNKPFQGTKSEPVTKSNYENHNRFASKSEITLPSKSANVLEKSNPIDRVSPPKFQKRPSEMNPICNEAPKKPLQETKSSPINNIVNHHQFQKRQREESLDSLQALQAPKKPHPKMDTPSKESSIFDIMTDIILPSKGENITPIQGLSKKDQKLLPPKYLSPKSGNSTQKYGKNMSSPKDDQHSPTFVPPKNTMSTPIQTVSKNGQNTFPTEAAKHSSTIVPPKRANSTPIQTVSKAGQGMLPPKDPSHSPKSANATSNVFPPVQSFSKSGQLPKNQTSFLCHVTILCKNLNKQQKLKMRTFTPLFLMKSSLIKSCM